MGIIASKSEPLKKIYATAASAAVALLLCTQGVNAQKSANHEFKENNHVTLLDTVYIDTFSKKAENTICVLDTVYVDDKTTTGQNKKEAELESFFPKASRPLSSSWFTWGADIGASIDMNTTDFSTLDINLVLGYKNQLIRTVGVGAGIHQAFGNGHSFIPVYAMFRSNFNKHHKMFFGEIKGGYSFNTMFHDHNQGGAYFSAGIGIELANSRLFSTHLILSYGWMGTKPYIDTADPNEGKHINYASLRFGINF